MASIIAETFTGSDNTQINGFNSWVASATGLQIKSNQAAKIDGGIVWAYKSATGWTGARTASFKTSRYEGSGLRFINYFALGSNNITDSASFYNNSIRIELIRGDINYPTSYWRIFDGATQVASHVSATNPLNGSEVSVTLTINADGSGTLKFTQSGIDINLSWSARTWTNGGGQYHGFWWEHSGVDGSGTVTRTQINEFYLDTTGGGGATFTPKTVVF